jgi:hypothetical protein
VYAVITPVLFAQTTEKNIPIGGSLQLKNMHLWRGQEVSDEVTLTTDINIQDRSNIFKFGIWGGMGVNGNFKEIDYYASFSQSGFTLAAWDIYNFSSGVDYNNRQAFNYSARETGHFADVSLAYQFQKNFPLKLYWATVVFGRDRGVLNEKNRYSSYAEISYPVKLKNEISLEIGVAGAFALSEGKDITGKKSKAHFYGDSPGIVNVNLTLSKDLNICGYKLPISIMTMWNPEKNYANMQIALNLIYL